MRRGLNLSSTACEDGLDRLNVVSELCGRHTCIALVSYAHYGSSYTAYRQPDHEPDWCPVQVSRWRSPTETG